MTLVQAAVWNWQELSATVQRSLEASAYDGIAVDTSDLEGVPPYQSPLPTLSPGSSLNPNQTLGTPSEEVPNAELSREGVRPRDFACQDFYVPDGKGSRLIHMSPKCSGIMSQTGNLLFIIRLHNLIEKYGAPFFGMDRVTSDFCAMEANSMTLILGRATVMLLVSTSVGVSVQPSFNG